MSQPPAQRLDLDFLVGEHDRLLVIAASQAAEIRDLKAAVESLQIQLKQAQSPLEARPSDP